MEKLKKKYIVDEKNKKIAVQLDIKTYEKIEEIMENYALYNLIKENNDDAKLQVKEAKEYYSKLDKLK